MLKRSYTGSSESTLVKMPHIVGNHIPRLNLFIFSGANLLINTKI